MGISIFNLKHVSLGVKPAVFKAFVDESNSNLEKYLTDKISKEKYLKTLAKDYLKIRSKILDFKIFYSADVMYLNNQLSGLEIYVLESFIKIVDIKDVRSKFNFSLNIGGSLSRGDFTPHSDIDHMIIAHERNNSIQVNSALSELLNGFKQHLRLESLIAEDATFSDFIIPQKGEVEIFDRLKTHGFVSVPDLEFDHKSFYKSALIDFKALYGNEHLLEKFKVLYSKQISVSIEQYLNYLEFSIGQKVAQLKLLVKTETKFPIMNIKNILRLYQFFVYYTKSYLIEIKASTTSYIDWIGSIEKEEKITPYEAKLFGHHFKFILSVRTILEKHHMKKSKKLIEDDYKILSRYLKMAPEDIVSFLREATRFIIQLHDKTREKLLNDS